MRGWKLAAGNRGISFFGCLFFNFFVVEEMELELLVCAAVGLVMVLFGGAAARLWHEKSALPSMVVATPFVLGVTLVSFAIFRWFCDACL